MKRQNETEDKLLERRKKANIMRQQSVKMKQTQKSRIEPKRTKPERQCQNETDKERQNRKQKDINQKKEKRLNETDADYEKRKKKTEAHLRNLNGARKVPKSKCDARNALQVLAGEQIVPELLNTDDSLGKMDIICKHCGARKWKNETPTLCCNSGKVVLDSFPAPPEVIQNLLTNNTVPAKLFRENSRSFNNALALSSIKVNERKFNNGYNPSVIF